jgi:MoaA/NifB/PqqE/SkfB family radical SAM enzyme
MRLIKHPILCNYYVTYRCNAKCSFCDIWERPSPYVTVEEVAKNLDDLKRLGVNVIDFTGGEPLLHRQIDQLLYLAKSKGFITTLTTNGLLYPKWARKIRGLVDMLHFSLDYASAEKHNTSRGVACFDKVMESIVIAKKLGENPDILLTAFDENLKEIPAVYQLCRKHKLMLIINPAFEYNDVGKNSPNSEDQLDVLERWGRKKGIYLNQAFIQLRRDGGNKTNDPVCKAGSSTIVISPENRLVMPCYHLGLKEYPIEGDLYNLYHKEEVRQQIALEGKHRQCEGCTINCYMQPSFAVNMNKYWWMALPSTMKYNIYKGTWKALFERNKLSKYTFEGEKMDLSVPN